MSVVSRKMRSARTVMSSRLPIGVATTYSVPAIEWDIYCTIGGSLPPDRRPNVANTIGAMPVSEPLPHFVDDLLGYLHETHPTYAALDGVHTHDDLLEDLSKQGIDHDVRALSGYLRRLEEIDKEGLPEIEALEQRMLSSFLRSRMFELEEVRTWEKNPQLYADILASSLASQVLFTHAPRSEEH